MEVTQCCCIASVPQITTPKPVQQGVKQWQRAAWLLLVFDGFSNSMTQPTGKQLGNRQVCTLPLAAIKVGLVVLWLERQRLTTTLWLRLHSFPPEALPQPCSRPSKNAQTLVIQQTMSSPYSQVEGRPSIEWGSYSIACCVCTWSREPGGCDA